ncbi:DUF4402 domain-containing protein [Altererythrobacter sp. BO-6]|uniref:DUF4402 domain-containing protein n=1 Tax=Altererythrobacter sp. BO-6 TaxID=2604537 RepID=UPI0013E1A666|nr:DUF4402 domain-containing protein [Altererythrobacter sp. BO-6]QIG54253.1 DUF4402 domain-containing protein [Altererythrobacter sp. BO-6]
MTAAPAVVLAAPLHAAPGSEGTAVGVATAEVIAPLKLETLEPLEFGTIAVAPNASGSITVPPSTSPATYSGALSASCSATAFCRAQPAKFAVTGAPGRHYRIEHPSEATAQAVRGSAPLLAVTQISVATESLGGESARGLLGPDGTDGFRIGGTLQIPGGTPAGTYRATLDVVVSYD